MRSQALAGAALTILAIGAVSLAIRLPDQDGTAVSLPSPVPVAATAAPTDAMTPGPTTSPFASPTPIVKTWAAAPWGTTIGMLQFRGNPQHTWYGLGPVPDEPSHAWRYPDRPLCSTELLRPAVVETDPETGEETEVEPAQTKRWCGTGWTGQPVLWERADGITEIMFGAYDGAVHFLDASTGERTRPPFRTGQMIKGTITLDPDGHPLLYTGSRDNHFRIIALDRDVPTELWRMSPHPQGRWNNDWDGNASIVDDILHVGGEDSWYRAVELHRTYDADGLVQVAPEVLVEVPGFNDQLFKDVGDGNVSIENSVALDIERQRVWFGNSGGRVVALDISRVREGIAPIVFDLWLGDDIDGSIVLDQDGTAIVAVEFERKNDRSLEVGQLVKLDADAPAGTDPIVWRVHVPDDPRPGVEKDDGGIWATPALYAGHLYVTTHPGDLLVVDAATGEVTFTERIGYHEWSSPVVVDDTLVVAACEAGSLLAYDLTDPTTPVPTWRSPVPSGSCLESTPVIWRGSIYVGSRDGYFHAWR